jgi:polyhydroxyalkanoate synthesis repressor PhaR
MPHPTAPATPDAAKRVIKKYPNRRLYDTDTSSYITLAQIKQMVMRHEALVVQDAKSGADLTRLVLLQIILEEEAHDAPLFTAPVLANVIRFYGHAMQGLVGPYLETSMQSLLDMQATLGDQMQGLTPQKWAQLVTGQSSALQAMVAQSVAQSQSVLSQMQEQLQKQTQQVWSALGIQPPTPTEKNQ